MAILKDFFAVFMTLNEVCASLLKGKLGCKLKYTNNLLFIYCYLTNSDVYLQKTYCTAHGILLTCYVAAWMGGELGGE